MSREYTLNEKRMIRHMLEQDGMCFTRYFFKLIMTTPMVINWHHYVIQSVLDLVMSGRITRLIINIPPGYTKTEIAVKHFIARALALYPRSKFIHTSSGLELALENSIATKGIIESLEYQEMWPMALRNDSKSKKKWFNQFGGGLYAAPAGGQITGFRAGRMETGEFTGAFINDDPNKPDDMRSKVKRERINHGYTNTMASRLALETTPMIIIMQRLHEDDLSGFLLKGGSGEKWYHLNIPVLLHDHLINDYPEKYTHGIQIKINDVLKSLREGVAYAV